MRKLIVCGVGLVAALALTVPGALGGAAQTPGVTAKSITIGGTFPLTGPAASYAPIPLGMKAYFSYVNARRASRPRIRQGGGSAWAPDHLQVLRRRLQPGQHGPADAEARRAGQGLRDCRTARHGAGARRAGLHEPAEGAAGARLDRRVVLGHRSTRSTRGRPAGSRTTSPRDVSTASTSRRTSTGRRSRSSTRTTTTERTTCTGSWRRSASSTPTPTSSPAEAVEATATSVASNMVRVRASGATILAVFQLPTPTMRTIATGKALGFNPEQIYMNSVASVKPAMDGMVAALGAPYINGIITITYGKDPQDPKWNNDAGDEAVPLDHREVRRGRERQRPAGRSTASRRRETFVQVLYKAGKSPTRAGLMNALTEHELHATGSCFLAWCRRRRRRTASSSARCSSSGSTATTRLWAPFGRLIEGRPR